MKRKFIIAIVQPFLLDKIVVALEDIADFPGITVTDAEGFGRRIRKLPEDSLNPFHPKKRIEIAAPSEMVDPIVEAINRHAHTGKVGDGMIFVLPIDQTVRI